MYTISYSLRMRLATVLIQVFGWQSAFSLAFGLNILDNGMAHSDAVSVACPVQKRDLCAALEVLQGRAAAPEAEPALRALREEINLVGAAVQGDLKNLAQPSGWAYTDGPPLRGFGTVADGTIR